MGTDRAVSRYRRLYAALLHLYPEPFRRRFAEGMEQTFHDLCRERRAEGGSLFLCALESLADTAAGIFHERMALVMPPRKNLVRLVLIVAAILVLPLLAMQFTDEVHWTAADFLVGGALLLGAGLAFEVISHRVGRPAYRAATGLAVGAGLLLTWMNLAVGLIGSDNNPANLLYLTVLLVGVIGAGIVRFRARGMVRVLGAMALVQLLVPLVALVIWRPEFPSHEPGLVRVIMINTFFVLLFVGSAFLFRQADSVHSRPN